MTISMFESSKRFSKLDFAEAHRLEESQDFNDAVRGIYSMFQQAFTTMTPLKICSLDLEKLKGLVKHILDSPIVMDVINYYFRRQMRQMSERDWDGSPAINDEVHETLFVMGVMQTVVDMGTKPLWRPAIQSEIHGIRHVNAPDSIYWVLPYMKAVRLFKVIAFIVRQISLLTSQESLSRLSEKKDEDEKGDVSESELDEAFFAELDRN